MNARLCLAASLAVFAADSARALTYFVSPTGDPHASGSARAAPTAAASALAKVNAGDVVVFLDGIYDKTLHLTRSGNRAAPVVLRADTAAVPVFRAPAGSKSDGLTADTDISHYVIDGLWFEGWGESGIGLSWNQKVTDIVIRNCVADLNGRNGFAPYFASRVTIENNIASRNGWAPDSWSSNFDMYGVRGNENVVRGNVSFHGVDTSKHRSDGNGFTLDLATNQGSAIFENNVGFLNGGSCITITDSANARLKGNTCYGNAQYGAQFLDEFAFANTCRPGIVGKVPLNGAPYTFAGLRVSDNLLLPVNPAKKGIFAFARCGGSTQFVNERNITRAIAKSVIQADPGITDFRTRLQPPRIVNFNFKCLKVETDPTKLKFAFWQFAPDLAYIKKIGGINKCFAKN